MSLSKDLKKLMEMPEFKRVIIDGYLDKDLKDLVFQEDLDNQKTIDELKARQSLRLYLAIIIESQNEGADDE